MANKQEKSLSTMTRRISATVARQLWDAGCVIIKSKPTFKWASGIQSPIYTDNRLLLCHPKSRNIVASAFLDLIKNQRFNCDVVAGVATSGIPMASILADRLNKPLVYVRPQPKAHGRGQQIEGNFKKGSRVILIEDLISTGGSSLAAADALNKQGAQVIQVLATFAYLPELAKKRFESVGLTTLSDADTLLKIGLKREYIGPAKERAARKFLDQLAEKLS